MKKSIFLKYSKTKSLVLQFEIFRTKKTNLPDKRTYTKVFCIGFGKTGTTSLEYVLKNLGFDMGNQKVAETIAEDWANSRSDRIIRYCQTAEAFQDMPFGLPGLYKELDKAFPNSKFILTVRDNPDQWFNSLVRFHSKVFGNGDGKPPTLEQLKDANYRYKGWPLDMMNLFFTSEKNQIYEEDYLKKLYSDHIEDVKKHFNSQDHKLLILNVANSDSYSKLLDFLEFPVTNVKAFPWLNKT